MQFGREMGWSSPLYLVPAGSEEAQGEPYHTPGLLEQRLWPHGDWPLLPDNQQLDKGTSPEQPGEVQGGH